MGEFKVGEKGTKGIEAEMERIGSKGFTYATSYQHSFGPIANETCYYDAKGQGKENPGFDLRTDLGKKVFEGFNRIHGKALGPETGGAGTAGFALVPVFVDPRIVDQSRKYTPLVEMIPRVTNQGMTADYNIITAKGGAYTAGLDAPLGETNDTYDRQSTAIKFLYSVGRVLGPMQAAMPSYILEGFNATGSGMVGGNVFAPVGAPNAKQTEVLVKAKSLKELEENLILNGDATSDATQFSGIVVQQGTVNRTNLAGVALEWQHVEETMQAAFDDGGRPTLAVASSGAVTALRSIMINTFGFRPADFMSNDTLPFGVPAQMIIKTMVGDVTVIPSMFLSNTSGAKSIYFLDMDFIEMRVLQDMTYEDLAKANDSSKFMLKIYECLILRSTPFNAFIANIL